MGEIQGERSSQINNEKIDDVWQEKRPREWTQGSSNVAEKEKNKIK